MPSLRRSHSRLCLFVAAFVFAIGSPAFAAKGGKQAGATPLSLVSESVWNSPNPSAPTWCLNEDDYHQRAWTGSLNGSFTVTERLCDGNSDYSGGIWWDAGGVGLQASVQVEGTLGDLAITSPQGDSHHAVLVGSSSSKGVSTNHYVVCYVPPFSATYDVGGAPLPGGNWQISLSGDIRKASYSITAEMADVNFQQYNCPPAQQNLTG